MEEKIVVRIFPDGRIQAETKGIKGEKCTNYMKVLEEILSARTLESTYTEEFYETEQVKIRQTEQDYLKTTL
ncbi:DUF2997 domain-containing protein [Metabacillus halosaccharovorans]|uniref:DUF2997 domain-containing protein n=1 Tax=Metabacillus halosaccharovorans TaxID=930124 RepID=UPI00203F32C3|nr:DUF2997 domain-containing protein [Metabacillus halosaccharovorans]MCM3443108.1 DUF2997 domain-containing protein [Metabacillus halosaccharovorans]